MTHPTIPRFEGEVTTDDLLSVNLDAKKECECNAAQRLAPEVANAFCRPCEARGILWKIESLKRRT